MTRKELIEQLKNLVEDDLADIYLANPGLGDIQAMAGTTPIAVEKWNSMAVKLADYILETFEPRSPKNMSLTPSNTEELRIGELVKQYRLSQHMSQIEFAKRYGYETPTAVSLWERTIRSVPNDVVEDVIKWLLATYPSLPPKELEKEIDEILKRLWTKAGYGEDYDSVVEAKQQLLDLYPTSPLPESVYAKGLDYSHPINLQDKLNHQVDVEEAELTATNRDYRHIYSPTGRTLDYEAAIQAIADGVSEGGLGVDWSVTDVMVAAIHKYEELRRGDV